MQDPTVLISGDKIRKKIKTVAKKIAKDYKKGVYCIVVLTGACIWFTDLMRELKKLKVEVQFAHTKLTSYENKMAKEDITIDMDVKKDIKGQDILVIEDIIDTGATMNFIKDYLLLRGAKRVRIACMLSKKTKKSKGKIDYACFEIPEKFVVGYGLDFDQRYRDLDYIGVFN